MARITQETAENRYWFIRELLCRGVRDTHDLVVRCREKGHLTMTGSVRSQENAVRALVKKIKIAEPNLTIGPAKAEAALVEYVNGLYELLGLALEKSDIRTALDCRKAILKASGVDADSITVDLTDVPRLPSLEHLTDSELRILASIDERVREELKLIPSYAEDLN